MFAVPLIEHLSNGQFAQKLDQLADRAADQLCVGPEDAPNALARGLSWSLAQRKQELHAKLTRLYAAPDPRQRGLTLERLLNELFKLDGLLIRESFVLRREDGQAQEQIDGVIEYAGTPYIAEVKWWNGPLGVDAVSRHLVRVYGRAGVGG